jgi:hypothetical protein
MKKITSVEGERLKCSVFSEGMPLPLYTTLRAVCLEYFAGNLPQPPWRSAEGPPHVKED